MTKNVLDQLRLVERLAEAENIVSHLDPELVNRWNELAEKTFRQAFGEQFEQYLSIQTEIEVDGDDTWFRIWCGFVQHDPSMEGMGIMSYGIASYYAIQSNERIIFEDIVSHVTESEGLQAETIEELTKALNSILDESLGEFIAFIRTN